MNPNPLEEQRQLTTENYLQNSFANPPSLSHSVWNNFASGWVSPFSAGQDLLGTLQENPDENRMKTFMESVEIENKLQGQSYFQRGANWVSDMIGFGLSPISLLGGEVGGAALRGVSRTVGKLLPSALSAFVRSPLTERLGETVGRYVPEKILMAGTEKTLSAGLLAEEAAVSFGVGAGAGIAPAIQENFSSETNSINWHGTARSIAQMGAMGIAIGSIPFALGTIRAKIKEGSKFATEEITTEELKEAVASGKISPEEADFYHNTINNLQDASELKASASQILLKDGHEVDIAANEIPVNILKPEDIDSLMTASQEQLISNAPEEMRNALSDFIVHNSLDDLRENPAQIEGMRGYSRLVEEKLKHKESKLSEIDRLIESDIEKDIDENIHFSQKNLADKMHALEIQGKSLDNLPFTVPKEIKSYFGSLKNIETLTNKRAKLQGQLRKASPEKKEKLSAKIKELKTQIKEEENKTNHFLTPKEEIKQLKEKLISPEGLMKDFETSPEYHRLHDLMEAWPHKQELFKNIFTRILTEHEYNKQEAFKSIIDNVVSIADSNAPRFADVNSVVRYAKARVEEPIKIRENLEPRKEAEGVFRDRENLLSDQKEQIQEINGGELNKEFQLADEKLNEFKSKSTIFNNLIACMLGAANAKAK